VSIESDELEWSRALAGDGEAFGRIFDRHRARVRRHSHQLVATGADAEDVVAITFLEAWRRRHDARFIDGSVLPWVLVIATNSAHNVSRGARRYAALLHKLPPAENVRDHADELGDAQRALSRLSIADQRVITLCVLNGFSERQAAQTLNIAPGTVKSRLSRAKSRLASQLGSAHRLSGPSSKEANNES
jgi:RNA polymerase sigma factor (sigma-70 family)